MADTIVVLNAGSSSTKFSIYGVDAPPGLICKGQIEGIGTAPRFVSKDPTGATIGEHAWPDARPDRAELLRFLIDWISGRLDGAHPVAVGHRVVHGGTNYAAPVRVDDRVLANLRRLIPLAPLHQPHNLSAIETIAAIAPDLPQVACFDTAFHHGHPPVVDRYAIPRELHDAGVRRYGFHGLSYEYIAQALPGVAPGIADGRIVIGHLGSGASLCAMHRGRSVDTTMGFSALDGLPMGTRPGALDAGVILYLMQERGMAPKDIESFLYKECGLKGVSGISNDLRDLESSEDPRAGEAIDLFVRRIGRELGGLAAMLGGLDGLVFTAGIGEHSALIRQRVCRDAAWLGVRLDERANAAHGPRISTADSALGVYVVPTDEERMIAHHTLALVGEAQLTEEMA